MNSRQIITLMLILSLGVFVTLSATKKYNYSKEGSAVASAVNYSSESLHDHAAGNSFSIVEEDTQLIDTAFLELYENAIVISPAVEEILSPRIPGTSIRENQKQQYQKQFIALSFDGSYSLNRWKSLLDFSKEQESLGKKIHFTFFASGIYFLENKNKKNYQGPGRSQGRSDIGFGGSKNEIIERISYLERAHAEGHEIASHANGHFSGSGWSLEEWKSELSQFEEFIAIADIPKAVGFRAPLLETNKFTYEALRDLGYTYDASSVANKNTPPWKDEFGIWHFPLVSIKIGGKNSLTMDYNHFVAQSAGKSDAVRGSEKWDRYYREVYNAYLDYFNNAYYGSRIPLNIGHHFSWWNDGVYYDALLDFAKTVCGKEEVICGTYNELVTLLESNSI